jgi:WD40 repeat protein
MKPLKIGKNYALALSPDGIRLAALGRFVFVWDLVARKKLFRCHPCTHPSKACYSPDGAHLAVKSTSGRIVIVAADDGRTVADFENQSEGEGSNVAYSACGTFLVDGSWGGCLRVRDANRGEIVFEEKFPQEMICAICRNATGQRWYIEHRPIARPSENRAPPAYFSLWEWPFQRETCSVLPCRFDHLYSWSLSHDGAYLAVVRRASADVLELYSASNATLLGTVPVAPGGTGAAIRWAPDGGLLGSVQDNRTAIYRIPDLLCVAEFPLPFPSDIAFCRQLQLAALGDWQQGIVVPLEW